MNLLFLYKQKNQVMKDYIINILTSYDGQIFEFENNMKLPKILLMENGKPSEFAVTKVWLNQETKEIFFYIANKKEWINENQVLNMTQNNVYNILKNIIISD